MINPITADQFKKRLVDLCVRSGLTEFPRKGQDRHILLKSMALTLNAAAGYSEREINEKLQSWLMNVGHSMDLDHAALRRQLVDEGYLERDKGGSCYRVSVSGKRQATFEPAVEDIDVYEVVRVSKEIIEQKKQDYLRGFLKGIDTTVGREPDRV